MTVPLLGILALALASPLPAGAESVAEHDDEAGQPPYARRYYVWPYATGPTYGLGEVSREEWAKPGMLHTPVGSFDLTIGLPQLPRELTATIRLDSTEHQYFVLQVHPDVLESGDIDDLHKTVRDFGGEVMESMDVGGFIVRLNSVAYSVIKNRPGLLALFPYHPAFKLSPSIGREPLDDPVAAISEFYRLRAVLFDGEDAWTVAEAIEAMGGKVTDVRTGVVLLRLHRSYLPALAALEQVKSVFEDLPVHSGSE